VSDERADPRRPRAGPPPPSPGDLASPRGPPAAGAAEVLPGRRGPTVLGALALLGLVAAILLAFVEVLGPEHGLFFRDHGLAYRPRWGAVREAPLDARIPTLTRASRGDVPLEVLLNGVYTPLTAVLLLGPFDVTYDLFVVSIYSVLGTGAFLLIRDFGGRPHEAAAGAAVAALSGPVLSLENLLAMTMGLAWTPWVWWAFRRVLVRRGATRAGWVGVSALVTGFQLQSLVPPVAYLDVFGAFFIALHARRHVNLSAVAAGIGAAVLALGVAAPDLLPTLEFLPHTRRADGLSYVERARWAVEIRELLELVVPAFWWAPERGVYTLRGAGGSGEIPFLASLYLGGALPLGIGAVIAAAGASRRPEAPWILGLAAVFVTALLAALGPVTSVHPALSSLPLLAQSRYPPKYLAWASFAAAGLVPVALRRLGADRRVLVGTVGSWWAGLVALAVLVHAPTFSTGVAGQVEPRQTFFSIQDLGPDRLGAVALEAMRERVVRTLLPATLLLGLAGLAFAPRRARVGHSAGPATAMAVVLAWDLAGAGRYAIEGASVDDARFAPAVADALAAVPDAGVQMHKGAAAYPAVRPRPGEPSIFAAGLRAWEERAGAPQRRDLRRLGDVDAEGFSHPLSTAGRRLFASRGPERGLRIAARLGVDWIGSFAPVPDLENVVLSIPGESPHFFGRVPERLRLDRVSIWTAWHEIPKDRDAAAVARWIGRGVAPGLPVRRAAVVAPATARCGAADDGPARRGANRASALTSTGTTAGALASTPHATVVLDTREAVEVRVAGACPTLVRVQQVHHPGWVATVDGRTWPIDDTDFGVLGVRVPPGEHEVRLVYRSRARRALPVGVASATLALALVALGAGLGRRGVKEPDRPRS